VELHELEIRQTGSRFPSQHDPFAGCPRRVGGRFEQAAQAAGCENDRGRAYLDHLSVGEEPASDTASIGNG
jgi:hypothetical protein